MSNTEKDLQAQLLECQEALRVERGRRLSAETTLQKARANFRKALQALPVIIYATDDDGGLIFFNREFGRVTGYTADDLPDSPGLLDLLLREDEGMCVINDAACRKWRIEAKNGQGKIVVWSEESVVVPLPGWRSWKIGLDITELEAARERVKILQGLLPICAHCKKIRNDEGAWIQLEAYISEQSEADFTHGICPECMATLYPEIDLKS